MRYLPLLLVFALTMALSSLTWAGSCERCYEKIADDKQLCTECELSTTSRLTDMKTRESQIVNAITTARTNYKNALEEIIQYYMDIGNHSRLKKARKELKSLSEMPQLKYLTASEKTTSPSQSLNIEEANILFQDGEAYRSSINPVKKKLKLKSAEIRFKKILTNYPKSDKADDAAYELASMYESRYFKDYESAAFYYAKCYRLNASTDKPARFKAAWIYDKHLNDYKKAIKIYRSVIRNSKDEAYRFTAKNRLQQLKKEGY